VVVSIVLFAKMAFWLNFIPVLVGVNIHQFCEHLKIVKEEAVLENAAKHHRKTDKHSE